MFLGLIAFCPLKPQILPNMSQNPNHFKKCILWHCMHSLLWANKSCAFQLYVPATVVLKACFFSFATLISEFLFSIKYSKGLRQETNNLKQFNLVGNSVPIYSKVALPELSEFISMNLGSKSV